MTQSESPASPPSGTACRTPAGASGSERQVIRAGVTWLVWEGPPSAYDRRSGNHLFFESASAVRRVRVFPADWLTLSDEALMRVAEGR